MDKNETERAKIFIKKRYNEYLKTVQYGNFSDEKVQAFLFDIFLEGRRQGLIEFEAMVSTQENKI
jgi:hypothetical protein